MSPELDRIRAHYAQVVGEANTDWPEEGEATERNGVTTHIDCFTDYDSVTDVLRVAKAVERTGRTVVASLDRWEDGTVKGIILAVREIL
jgi:hypothetical protein